MLKLKYSIQDKDELKEVTGGQKLDLYTTTMDLEMLLATLQIGNIFIKEHTQYSIPYSLNGAITYF